MKKTLFQLTAVSLFALSFFAMGCSKPQDSQVTKTDQHGDEVMSSTNKAEAREWIKGPSTHVFFKADPKQVSQYVEDFYNAGATQVFIADIEVEDNNQYGEALLVVLPTDAAARAKVFQVDSRASTDFQESPATDQGQKYLYYSLD
jgi:hypothetical protein